MSPVNTITSRELQLVARPDGEPTPDHFALVETQLRPPGEGEVLVRNTDLSVDPYMRGRMDDAESYVAPFPLHAALERMPDALLGLYRGENVGKMVVRLDPSRA